MRPKRDPNLDTTHRPLSSSFYGLYSESYKAIPKRNYLGAYGYPYQATNLPCLHVLHISPCPAPAPQDHEPLIPNSNLNAVPIGSIVVPFLGLPYRILNRTHQAGTTLEPKPCSKASFEFSKPINPSVRKQMTAQLRP